MICPKIYKGSRKERKCITLLHRTVLCWFEFYCTEPLMITGFLMMINTVMMSHMGMMMMRGYIEDDARYEDEDDD